MDRAAALLGASPDEFYSWAADRQKAVLDGLTSASVLASLYPLMAGVPGRGSSGESSGGGSRRQGQGPAAGCAMIKIL